MEKSPDPSTLSLLSPHSPRTHPPAPSRPPFFPHSLASPHSALPLPSPLPFPRPVCRPPPSPSQTLSSHPPSPLSPSPHSSSSSPFSGATQPPLPACLAMRAGQCRPRPPGRRAADAFLSSFFLFVPSFEGGERCRPAARSLHAAPRRLPFPLCVCARASLEPSFVRAHPILVVYLYLCSPSFSPLFFSPFPLFPPHSTSRTPSYAL